MHAAVLGAGTASDRRPRQRVTCDGGGEQRAYRPAQRMARSLSWAVERIQPALYLFLRRAFVHAQTQWTGTKNVEAALEPGGDLERYVELWKTVTTPRLRPDSWSTYVSGNFLFFTVVLVDLLRLVKVIFQDLHKSIALPTRHRSHYRFLTRLLDDFFDIPPQSLLGGEQPARLRRTASPKERWQQACRARNQVWILRRVTKKSDCIWLMH